MCYALRTSQLFNTPNLSRSAYVAHTQADKCVACGRCVEVCPAGAVKLGQKLCSETTGSGSGVSAPGAVPIPAKRGPEKWSPNYRNDNRVETHKAGTAPCKTACPAHIAVQRYLKLAAQGRYDEALALIKRENPLPAGVRPHSQSPLRRDACTRGRVDAAVAIDEVKKFIAQRDLDAATRDSRRWSRLRVRAVLIRRSPSSAPALRAFRAPFYLAERGYKPVVFEEDTPRPGGMLTYGIPSFKLEKDVIDAEVEVIREMGAEFRYGVEVGRDVTLAELREQGFAAFYVADPGRQGGRLPGIDGQDAKGTWIAVDFLVKHTDQAAGAAPAMGRTVVAGGGNVAIDAARVAARTQAPEVTMLRLESAEEMPASDEEVAEAREDGVDIRCRLGPQGGTHQRGGCGAWHCVQALHARVWR